MAGFRPVRIQHITLQVNHTARFDLVQEVGQVSRTSSRQYAGSVSSAARFLRRAPGSGEVSEAASLYRRASWSTRGRDDPWKRSRETRLDMLNEFRFGWSIDPWEEEVVEFLT